MGVKFLLFITMLHTINADAIRDYTHFVRHDSGSSDHCRKSSSDCLMETYRDTMNRTHMDVLCECYFGPVDVSSYLADLMSRPCPIAPVNSNQILDYGVFNLTNCYVQAQVLPISLMIAMRRTRHLIVWVEGARALRLPTQQFDQLDRTQITVAIKITNSSVSGFGRGITSGCQKLRLEASHSNLGVIGSGAFAHYDEHNSDVDILITDSVISKLAKGSVQLPVSGELNFERVKIDAIDGGALAGAGRISFVGSIIGLLNTGAVSIAKMNFFKMKDCKIAQVMERAVRYQSAEHYTNVGHTSDSTFRQCHLLIQNCSFMRIHSTAFLEGCHAAQLTFDLNLIMDVTNGPLLLENEHCRPSPSSSIKNIRMKCSNCSSMASIAISEKMCAVYGSATCAYCNDRECTRKLTTYLRNDCREIERAILLQSTCEEYQERMPRRNSLPSTSQLLKGGSGGLHAASRHILVTICIILKFLC